VLFERAALGGASDEVEPAALPTLFLEGPLSDAALEGIGAAGLDGAASARVSVGADGALAASVGVAEPVPAGASPIALGGVVTGWLRTFIAAANPPSPLSPVAPAKGAAAPSFGRVVGAVESTAEAAIMGRQSVSGRRRLLRQNIRPAQATTAPLTMI
jgi:hypothetical protein